MLSKPQELTQQGIILEAAVEAAAKEIIALKDSLNEWDGKVGDGDCGTTVSPHLGHIACFICIFFLMVHDRIFSSDV